MGRCGTTHRQFLPNSVDDGMFLEAKIGEMGDISVRFCEATDVLFVGDGVSSRGNWRLKVHREISYRRRDIMLIFRRTPFLYLTLKFRARKHKQSAGVRPMDVLLWAFAQSKN